MSIKIVRKNEDAVENKHTCTPKKSRSNREFKWIFKIWWSDLNLVLPKELEKWWFTARPKPLTFFGVFSPFHKFFFKLDPVHVNSVATLVIVVNHSSRTQYIYQGE